MITDNLLNQQLTIGMMLNFKEAAVYGASRLIKECFSSIEFQTVFRVIKEQVNKNIIPTIYTVNNALETQGKVLSLDELINIREEFYIPEAFESLVDSLMDIAQRRITAKTLNGIVDKLNDNNQSFNDIVKDLGNIHNINSNKEVMNSSNYIEARKQQDFKKKHLKEIRSGFTEIDECLTYKFPGGEISLVAARPNNGKSTFKTNFIRNFCEMSLGKEGVASYALEQTLMVESDRLEAIVSGISLVDIAQNKLWGDNDTRWDILNAAREKISKWNYHLLEGTGKSELEILSEVKNLYYKHNVRLFFFDLFDRMQGIVNAMNDKPAKIGQVMNMFLTVAKELDIHFCFLVQINRDAVKVKRTSADEKSRKKRRPEMHELKGSGNYEEFARTIMILHNPRTYEPDLVKAYLEVEIAKQNNGPSKKFDFHFDTDTLRITSLTEKETAMLKGGKPSEEEDDGDDE